MYSAENYKTDIPPQETRALQFLAGGLNGVYQRLNKINVRLTEANARAFGQNPSAGEKSAGPQPHNGLLSELSFGLNAIDEIISLIESQVSQVEKII